MVLLNKDMQQLLFVEGLDKNFFIINVKVNQVHQVVFLSLIGIWFINHNFT